MPTRHHFPLRRLPSYLTALLLTPLVCIHAQDLSDYSLEDLVNVPVVVSSKQSERLFDAPASAFVFDEEAIEYMPVDSVPEMLRYAPGVNMIRATNGIWGMGIRGMNSRFLGRALFTVDEQNIYSTLYAGLFGSQHDLFMPDVASVEVVYGPGGTLWGTNAANGNINVILKSAFETEDTLVTTQFGSMNRNIGARSGWSINENTSARVFAKYGHREAGNASIFDDEWKSLRAGFQLDHRASSRDLLTFSSEIYASELGWQQHYVWQDTGTIGILSKPEKQWGINAQGKWTHQEDSENGFTLRTWTGYTAMDSGYVEFNLGVAGAEFRARYAPSDKDQFIFTLGGTLEHYDLKDTIYSTFHDDYQKQSFTAHGGVEYTRTLIPSKLDLTTGLNAQYESHAESSSLLPSIRLLYRPDDKTRLWASFSRAARPVVAGMNDVTEILFSINPINPVSVPTPYGDFTISKQVIYGVSARDINPEKLYAFEIGIRRQIHDRLALKANFFHYEYKDVIGGLIQDTVPILNAPEPYFKSNYKVSNVADGASDGFEISAELTPFEHTRMVTNYSVMRDDFDPIIELPDVVSQVILNRSVGLISNSDPSQTFSTWWIQQWSPHFRTDAGIRFSGSFANVYGRKDASWQSDVKASWEPNPHLRISLVGRNLLKDSTKETPLRDMLSLPTEQPREWYLEMRYQF